MIVKAFRRARRVFATLSEYKFTTIAGTLVFFLIMSLVPFLFWLVLLFGKSVDIEQIFALELFEWASDLLVFFRNNAEDATAGAGILFLATTLWSSTGFFYHLRRSGEIIYHYRRKKNGWKVRASAAVFTLLLLLYFAAAGAVLIGANLFARSLPQWLFYLTVYALVMAFGFFAAWILNLYICPYRCSPSDTVIGSLLTAVLWLVFSVAFTVYLRFANPERLYGALSLFIVFLLYLYWIMIGFTSGVIYNRRAMKLKELDHKKL